MPGTRLADLNSVISCVLCGGYLVNATTLVECLHSFCKVCIVRYLATSKLCPICDVPVHKSKPLQYIRVDNTLQDIVYKVVPGLYQREMRKRREFYEQQTESDGNISCPEDRGLVDSSTRQIFSPDDTISLSLEYSTGKPAEEEEAAKEDTANTGSDASPQKEPPQKEPPQRRFLSCPAAFTVNHLQKFIRMKYDLGLNYKVDILYMDDTLHDGYSLMDIAYIYAWKRDCPLRLFFRVHVQPLKRPVVVEVPSLVVQPDAQEEAPVDPSTTQETMVVEEGLVKPVSAPQPMETPASPSRDTREPPVLAPCGALAPSDRLDVVPPAVPAAETRLLETPEMQTAAEEESTAPGSPKIVTPVQQSSPQRQKATETPVEAQSPPPLSKITISTLDKNSNKILIQTKEVTPDIVQALSPPRNGESAPSSKKSKRREQKEADRQHSSKRKSPEKQDRRSNFWGRSPEHRDEPPAKRPRQDETEVDSGRGSSAAASASPRDNARSLESAALPEPAQQNHSLPKSHSSPKSSSSQRKPPPLAHPQSPKTPPSLAQSQSVTRAEEDTRPLDLSVSHRAPAPETFRRPRGRPPLPLPTVGAMPLVTKRPSPPPPYKMPTPLFHKAPATTAAVSPSSSHHHHHHHRSNSKSFLKGANLTCINPDPNAFHPRIVIKNVPPRGSVNNFHRV